MAEPVYPPPPSDALNTIEDMRDAVFFDEPGRAQRVRRFWILLALSSAIAASGVVGDSTATVIGAMIVAPMMLPIQGTMLATVLGERVNFGRSLFTMIAGAAAAIAIGYLVGLLVVVPETAATNPQIAERATPDLMSLFGALATGAVASIALVRKDISDTLPGVAIAISLVPPLVVVGVAAESADYAAAIGSLLLFVANVAAILGTGVVVMALYRVQRWGSFAIPGTAPVTTATGTIRPLATVNRRRSHITIALLLVLVAIPLTLSTYRTVTTTLQSSDVDGIARSWADDEDLEVLDIATASPGYVVRVTGGDSVPDVAPLRTALEADDIAPSTVAVEWVPTTRVSVGG
ncbi:DUF389 domain-containing protein [Agromyces endophyticus]|uniref:DUF389 domain-containing protein n=1 Tax=Agromyces sp. H17E-10 TaxID=2932244 RepID=UPI001FD501E8|nr:DUF389 domain-containing protein [Agromyces sp. H17E-10]UOQ87986.1 DUF389 domain-containing protein [Agromyces sp. H17E-10]